MYETEFDFGLEETNGELKTPPYDKKIREKFTGISVIWKQKLMKFFFKISIIYCFNIRKYYNRSNFESIFIEKI